MKFEWHKNTSDDQPENGRRIFVVEKEDNYMIGSISFSTARVPLEFPLITHWAYAVQSIHPDKQE